MTIDLRDRILDVPDFPTEGIVFKDVMPLLADPRTSQRRSASFRVVATPRTGPDPRRGSPRVHLRRSARLRARRGVHRRTEAREAAAGDRGGDVCARVQDGQPAGAPRRGVGGRARHRPRRRARDRRGREAKIDLVERLGGIVAGALFVIELTFLDGRTTRATFTR